MKPSVGRIVHFWSPDAEAMGYVNEPVPAIITSVLNDDVVSLVVFRDGMDPVPQQNVTFSEDESGGIRWFWPPRV
jgi:hypothetical protein